MIKTKDFTLTDVDNLEYDVSVDYESDSDEIVAVVIPGDLKYILDGAFMEQIEEEHNRVDEYEG